MPIPPSALGRICENRVIEALILFSKGDLVCYRPESDFEGTDLIFTRRHRPGEVRLQVKGRAERDRRGNLAVEVEDSTVPAGDPKFLVVVEYLLRRAEMGRFAWVVHTDSYRRLASHSGHQWRATFSPRPTAVDRWVDFRYNFGDLAWVVTALIERKAGGGALPVGAGEVRKVWGRRGRAKGAPDDGSARLYEARPGTTAASSGRERFLEAASDTAAPSLPSIVSGPAWWSRGY